MIETSPQIDILLAAYMGENYLAKQLDSLISQSYANIRILLHDDGSTDQTPIIIDEYINKFPDRISRILSASRLGPKGSFQHLLRHSSADYMVFCDHDDVWFMDKVEMTFEKMLALEKNHGTDCPVLVHSDLKVVDSELNVISGSYWAHQNISPFGRESLNRLLVQNVITGCTVMINKPLHRLSLSLPENAVMHDWWLALIASAFGEIGHINRPTMFYRQHGANEIGAKRWNRHYIRQKIFGDHGRVRDRILAAQRQARAFLDIYGEQLPGNKRKAVECYAFIDEYMYLKRIYLLIRHRLFKAGLIRNLGFWTHI